MSRMRIRAAGSAAVLSLLLLSTAAGAQAPAASPLDPLGWFVGGVWVANVPGPGGAPVEIRFRCRWAEHRRALVYDLEAVQDGKALPTHQGMFYWHPGRKEIALVEAERDGSLTEGWGRANGRQLALETVWTAGSGEIQRRRDQAIRDGDNAFVFKAQVLKDGEWVEAVEFRYERRPDPPAAAPSPGG